MVVTTATVKATSASATFSEMRKFSAQIHGIHPPCKDIPGNETVVGGVIFTRTRIGPINGKGH